MKTKLLNMNIDIKNKAGVDTFLRYAAANFNKNSTTNELYHFINIVLAFLMSSLLVVWMNEIRHTQQYLRKFFKKVVIF